MLSFALTTAGNIEAGAAVLIGLWIAAAVAVANFGDDRGFEFRPLFLAALCLGFPIVLLAVTIGAPILERASKREDDAAAGR